jgi:hypothetical protein
LGVAAALAAGVYLYRRYRRPRHKPTTPSEREAQLRETAELYRAVDAALSVRGVPRPSGTPPLTHVRGLGALGHPAAEPALRLTERYLQARFGKQPLSSDERRDFLRDVRELARPPKEQRAA